MSTESASRNIEWWDVKDPHPAALPNLRQVVDYMISVGATNNGHTLSVYALAKMLDRQHKQVSMLIKDRPGFVLVMRDGKQQGYYWDRATFGTTYPERFGMLRAKPTKAVEDMRDSHIETIKDFNKKMPEMAKQLRTEALKPDVELPGFAGQPTEKMTVSFSLLPVEIAKDLLQTSSRTIGEGELSNEAATDIMTALLSLLFRTKENHANVQ